VTHPSLTIEVPNETLAEELRRHLQSFDVDKVEAEAHWELQVHLHKRNRDNRITSALHAIDSWLPKAGIDFVRVHVDGSSYTVHASPDGIAARAS
jgi:uncharacterized protein with PIN domain